MSSHRWPWLLAFLFLLALSAIAFPADEPATAQLASALQTFQSRNYAAAEKQFDDILAKQPQSVAALVGRGSCLLYRLAFEKALADFEAAAKLAPASVAARIGIGTAHAELRQWTEAAAAYGEALKLDARAADAYIGRGGVHLAQDQIEHALADYDRALEVQPHSAAAFVGRGAVRLQRHDPAMATADYNEALRLDPESVPALEGRGYAYFKRKDFGRARSDFSEAVRCEPENAEALNRLAWLLAVCPEANMRDGKKAVELARRACSLTKNESPYFLDTLAAGLAETGDFPEAVEMQKRAIAVGGKMDHNSLEQARNRLTLYSNRKSYREP